MLTVKNLIKWIILIATTALMQIETIEAEGHWIIGGNVAFPFLMAILCGMLQAELRNLWVL